MLIQAAVVPCSSRVLLTYEFCSKRKWGKDALNCLFNRARDKEIEYHDKFYAEIKLFQPGSWLSRPVKVVLDNLMQIEKTIFRS
ncbi:hypothetical protein ACYEXS_30485 [Paenibacillus sp. MAH-36]|uniref:Uncharacterized protein n=1 Tax=Paenibacillus violae TaxID=3077234 RepID=A0ABU3RKM2_9BACL|nr:hypothetical protein [Paenibacillus sp. PFR10]MDU0204821.1 hypothetical protein [Paenibacillus sp. PFR10]